MNTYYEKKWCFVHFSNGKRKEEHYDSFEMAQTRLKQYFNDVVNFNQEPDVIISCCQEQSYYYQNKRSFQSGYIFESYILVSKRNYKVLQLKNNEKRRSLAWLPFEDVEGGPKLENYNSVFESVIVKEADLSDKELLEMIYIHCQSPKEENYKGHSLSMSDVVMLDGKPYYCDTYGFQEF